VDEGREGVESGERIFSVWNGWRWCILNERSIVSLHLCKKYLTEVKFK